METWNVSSIGGGGRGGRPPPPPRVAPLPPLFFTLATARSLHQIGPFSNPTRPPLGSPRGGGAAGPVLRGGRRAGPRARAAPPAPGGRGAPFPRAAAPRGAAPPTEPPPWAGGGGRAPAAGSRAAPADIDAATYAPEL